MFDVSIIIVSWNAKEYLVNCLNSLIKENRLTKEIIVIDNDSSDGSPEEVEKLFPHVELIRNEENLGFARANNIGIRKAKGRYICLINSDVIVIEKCIYGLLKFMDNHRKVGMLGPRILNLDYTLQPSCRHFPSIWNNMCLSLGLNRLFPKSRFFSDWFMNYWSHDSVRIVDVLSGCFWMVRREALDEVGLLDEGFFIYGEDVDWCRRFHKSGWDVMFYPDAEAIHFGGASSANAPVRFCVEMQKADLRYWRKYHGFLSQALYIIILFFHHMIRILPFGLVYVFSRKKREIARFKLNRAFACICFLFGFNIVK